MDKWLKKQKSKQESNFPFTNYVNTPLPDLLLYHDYSLTYYRIQYNLDMKWKRKYGITNDQLVDIIINHLKPLHKDMPSFFRKVDWEKVGYNMGLTEFDIQRILNDHVKYKNRLGRPISSEDWMFYETPLVTELLVVEIKKALRATNSEDRATAYRQWLLDYDLLRRTLDQMNHVDSQELLSFLIHWFLPLNKKEKTKP